MLDALAASGMSARHFALAHGLSVQRIYWWRKRVVEADLTPSSGERAELIPIRLPDELSREGAALVHLANGVVLEVPLSASPDWIAAVVRTLTEA